MERLSVRHEAADLDSSTMEQFAGLAAYVRQDDDPRAWIFSAEVAVVLAANDAVKAKEYEHDSDED